MKYKIHDILTGTFFPKSNEIYFSTDFAVEDSIQLLLQQGIVEEQLEVWIYEDWAFCDDPADMQWVKIL